MPSRFESYRMVDGKTPLAAAYFNPILQELDLRLGGLEELRASWLEAVAQVQELGLARINELVGQPMQTVNDAISEMEHRIAALPHMVSQEQLSHQLQQAMQAEEQARAQLQQALDTLHQTVHQMGGVDVFPSMEGKAGQFLTNDGDGRAWGIPKVTDLQRGTAQPRQLLGVSHTGVLVGMPPLELLDYADRAQLRALTEGIAIVRGLGVFAWEAGSTEPDDDETCFAAAGGAWLLTAAAPDVVHALMLGEVSALKQHMDRFLSTEFAMTATTLAANAQVTFSAALEGAAPGDSVVVTPLMTVASAVSVMGVVIQTGVISISLRNASSATVTLTPGSWPVLVIKP